MAFLRCKAVEWNTVIRQAPKGALIPVFDDRALIGPRNDANGERMVPYAEDPTQNKM